MTRIVVISGVSSGIGTATAAAFKQSGAVVVGIDVQDPPPGLCHRFIQGDVSVPETWSRSLAASEAMGGQVEVLVNNAGVNVFSSIEEMSLDKWNRVLAVNLTGCYMGTRTFLSDLRETRGSIVNVASALGIVGGDRVSAYCASKGGVVMLTRALAVELGSAGIRVNCVCPGPIDTPLLRQDAAAFERSDDLSTYRNRTTVGRLGEPSEVARAILFLASDDASFITGIAMPVDGGRLSK